MTIQDLLSQLGVSTQGAGSHHHSRPGWIQMDCPYCGKGTSKYHLGFNLRGRYFNCWRCGRLNTYQVLQDLGASKRVAVAYLKTAKEEELPELARVRTKLVEPMQKAPMLTVHKRYLSGRGFDPDELERVWSLEGIGISRSLGWRIYIPIIYRDQRVSWTTRAIGDKVERRYISASPEEEAINHKELVYGIDYCHHSIVIVEGPADAWAIGPGAGALFGTAFSTAQIAKLARVPYRFVCFDSSTDAQRQARDLCGQLCAFEGETVNIQLDAKDPGSASEKELSRLRRIAKL